MSFILRTVLLGLFIPVAIIADTIAAAERVVIRFVDIGSIRDWHAESSAALFVQNLKRQWYRITFAPPCQNLPFVTGIAFEPDNFGNIDKDSSIVIDGERCFFQSIEESIAPASATGTTE